MHLCPAFVTTTNSRKRKSKMTGKQKLKLLAHQQWIESVTKNMKKDKKVLDKLWRSEYTNSMVVDRSALQKTVFVSGACAKPEEKVYTGTKLLGIATMHKSNMVPVFKAEDAADIASMRR
jgi:hypothetical protein